MKKSIKFPLLIQVLQETALHNPDKKAYSLVHFMSRSGDIAETTLNFRQLDEQARAVAGFLQKTLKPGDRALLFFPAGLEFIYAFYGCLYSGVIAIPAPPPYPAQLQSSLLRLKTIIDDARPGVILTETSLMSMTGKIFQHAPELNDLQWIDVKKIDTGTASLWREPEITPATIAFLQYTSGSTSDPKGVMVSHGNLLQNSRNLHYTFCYTPDSRLLVWMPNFHDYGLIEGILQPAFQGIPAYIMSQWSFIQNPARWLQAISKFRITHSSGPNFAYDLCCAKVRESDCTDLDLSSWQTAGNGAEPIRPETIEKFTEKFRPFGFRRDTFFPAYGLAECTLVVSGHKEEPGEAAFCFVDKNSLEREQKIVVTGSSPDSRKLAGCGLPSLLDGEIRIVNPVSLDLCARDEEGEIWVSGSSVACGYWNKSEETGKSFGAFIRTTGEGPFLRTGDLGFFHEGELYITGRYKDLIIIRGQNYYPQDIELIAEQSYPALRVHSGAAFAVDVSGCGEQLVIVHEIERRCRDTEAAAAAVRQAVGDSCGLEVYAVVLIRQGSLLKTSSGKVQRRAIKHAFLENTLDVVYLSLPDREQEPGDEDMPACDPAVFTMEPAAGKEELIRYLQEITGRILGQPAADLDFTLSLSSLGMDSLKATELSYRLERDFCLSFPMTLFLEAAAIDELAGNILLFYRQKFAGTTDTIPGFRPAVFSSSSAPVAFPLSVGQKALWILYQVAPQSTAYNIGAAFKITGEFDPLLWEEALKLLVLRHAGLRTYIAVENNEPVQKMDDEIIIQTPVTDAAAWNEQTLSRELAQILYTPFCLEKAPLFRFALFHCAPGEYVFSLTLHHIIADFWSIAVLFNDLGRLYTGLLSGKPPVLQPLTHSYADYVHWQQSWLSGPEQEKMQQYWQKQQLTHYPALELPADRSRPPVQTYRGAALPFRLDRETGTGIKAMGRSAGTTLYTTLLALYETLLYRYSGQERFTVGSPAAGRRYRAFENVSGYFTNPVVLQADFSGKPSFRDLLLQVKQTVLEALENQDIPFLSLVESLKPERDPARPPLFQVMFVWQQIQGDDLQDLSGLALETGGIGFRLGGLNCISLAPYRQSAQFDLTLMMAEVNGEIRGVFKYNTDLFIESTIKRMVEHFCVLAAEVCRNAGIPVEELVMTSPRERELLLNQWSGSRIPDYETASLADLFETQAEKTPDAAAVVCGPEQLTWRELQTRAGHLACLLQERGIGPESFAGICLGRSPDFIVALLAVLKAGAAYVPIDPLSPQARIELLAEGLDIVLTHSGGNWNGSSVHFNLLCVDQLPAPDNAASVFNHTGEALADNPVYMIHTSGSTGKPKGVVVSRKSLGQLFSNLEKTVYAGLGEGTLRIGINAAFTFDSSVKQIIQLFAGRTLYIFPENIRRNPGAILCYVEEHDLDVFDCTPSLLELLLNAGLGEMTPDRRRTILVGGEAINPMLRDRLAGLEHLHFINLYGPTECTVDTVMAPVNLQTAKPVIGRPLPGVRVYVLDKRMQPVPVGLPGELYLGGDCLARGYFGNPAETAVRFVPDPFGTVPGARLYRTGDLVEFTPDGNLVFVGRTDFQVKIRGYRIEPAEIAGMIIRYPGVSEAVVLTLEKETMIGGAVINDTKLVAYIVSDVQTAEQETAIRDFLKNRLPDYMLPAGYVFLDALPLNAHGKMDRGKLPLCTHFTAAGDSTGEQAASPVEEVLSDMWAIALGLPAVGRNDNFFELGGHSMLAIQLTSQLQEIFPTEEPLLNIFFEDPTIAGLAAAITRGQNDAEELSRIAEIIREVNNMSDDEIEALLGEKA